MEEMITKFSRDACGHYGDTATSEFYRRMGEGQFATTYCDACEEFWYPPRPVCPRCFSRNVVWKELPKRGKLYAFTQQERALRFVKPDVIGLVEIEGLGKIFTRIDAPYGTLAIGMEVELDFIKIDGEFTLHQFRPVK